MQGSIDVDEEMPDEVHVLPAYELHSSASCMRVRNAIGAFAAASLRHRSVLMDIGDVQVQRQINREAFVVQSQLLLDEMNGHFIETMNRPLVAPTESFYGPALEGLSVRTIEVGRFLRQAVELNVSVMELDEIARINIRRFVCPESDMAIGSAYHPGLEATERDNYRSLRRVIGTISRLESNGLAAALYSSLLLLSNISRDHAHPDETATSLLGRIVDMHLIETRAWIRRDTEVAFLRPPPVAMCMDALACTHAVRHRDVRDRIRFLLRSVDAEFFQQLFVSRFNSESVAFTNGFGVTNFSWWVAADFRGTLPTKAAFLARFLVFRLLVSPVDADEQSLLTELFALFTRCSLVVDLGLGIGEHLIRTATGKLPWEVPYDAGMTELESQTAYQKQRKRCIDIMASRAYAIHIRRDWNTFTTDVLATLYTASHAADRQDGVFVFQPAKSLRYMVGAEDFWRMQRFRGFVGTDRLLVQLAHTLLLPVHLPLGPGGMFTSIGWNNQAAASVYGIPFRDKSFAQVDGLMAWDVEAFVDTRSPSLHQTAATLAELFASVAATQFFLTCDAVPPMVRQRLTAHVLQMRQQERVLARSAVSHLEPAPRGETERNDPLPRTDMNVLRDAGRVITQRERAVSSAEIAKKLLDDARVGTEVTDATIALVFQLVYQLFDKDTQKRDSTQIMAQFIQANLASHGTRHVYTQSDVVNATELVRLASSTVDLFRKPDSIGIQVTIAQQVMSRLLGPILLPRESAAIEDAAWESDAHAARMATLFVPASDVESLDEPESARGPRSVAVAREPTDGERTRAGLEKLLGARTQMLARMVVGSELSSDRDPAGLRQRSFDFVITSRREEHRDAIRELYRVAHEAQEREIRADTVSIESAAQKVTRQAQVIQRNVAFAFGEGDSVLDSSLTKPACATRAAFLSDVAIQTLAGIIDAFAFDESAREHLQSTMRGASELITDYGRHAENGKSGVSIERNARLASALTNAGATVMTEIRRLVQKKRDAFALEHITGARVQMAALERMDGKDMFFFTLLEEQRAGALARLRRAEAYQGPSTSDAMDDDAASHGSMVRFARQQAAVAAQARASRDTYDRGVQRSQEMRRTVTDADLEDSGIGAPRARSAASAASASQ